MMVLGFLDFDRLANKRIDSLKSCVWLQRALAYLSSSTYQLADVCRDSLSISDIFFVSYQMLPFYQKF